MADLDAQLSITADASGVEAGVGKAKRSLKDLGATAASQGKQGADGLNKVTTATGRAAQAIDRTVAKYQLQAATVGKSESAIKLFELRQRGASRAQLEAAANALKAVDAQKIYEASLERSRKAAAALGVALATMSVGALVGFSAAVRKAVSDIDAFNDLKDATGASIETISALDRVARETGGTFEQVSSILTKFNQALKDVDSNKRIASVFKALNLDAAELRKLDPAEALRRTAVAFSTFADDGNKARAAQELFGRSVREIAPLLKDLSEKNELVASTTTEAAEEAEKFGKNMARLKANVDDVARSLANRFVPVLNRMIEDVGSFREKANLASLAGDVIRLKKELDALQTRKASPFNFAADIDAQIAEATKRLADAKARFNAADVDRPRSAGGGRGFVNPSNASALPSLQLPPEEKDPKGPRGDALAEAKRYLESLQKQIEATRDLTVYEQALADITQKRLGKVTPELEKSILATARQVDTAIQAKAALDGMTRAREMAMQMQERADESALASVQQQIEANQALREEIELIGLSVSARAAVERARVSSTLALKEEELAMLRNAEASEVQISALEREIALLKERQSLFGQRAERTAEVEAEEQSKEFSDGVRDDLKRAFFDAFRDTDNPLKAFGDSLYATISARVSAALAESLATQALDFLGLGASGGGGFLGALLGPGKANGGPVSAGRIYPVNERGPELLDVGGKQYLMMGNRSGNVVPNDRLGRGSGAGMQVTNHFAITGPVDRRTQLQIAQEVGRSVQTAMARNG